MAKTINKNTDLLIDKHGSAIKKYDPNIPFPMQIDQSIRTTDYNGAVKLLEEKNDPKHTYETLFKYYVERLAKAGWDNSTNTSLQAAALATSTYTHYMWCKYKQIYKFNPELFGLLTEETENKLIIADVFLKKLPFDCFFVENTIQSNDGIDYLGFYVLKRYDGEKGTNINIHLVRYINNVPMFDYVSLVLEEGKMMNLPDMIAENMKKYGGDKDVIKRNVEPAVQKAFNLVTYLCSDKVDVYRMKKHVPNKNPKQKPKSVNANVVGDKIARVIKENRVRYVYDKSESDISGKGSPKAPHIRRAHFHSFWTGKRSDPKSRQLVVKLISPIFVHGETPRTTIREVSSSKHKRSPDKKE